MTKNFHSLFYRPFHTFEENRKEYVTMLRNLRDFLDIFGFVLKIEMSKFIEIS